MEKVANLSWVEFYSAFADKLLAYVKDRGTLIEKLRSVYQSIDLKFPKIDSGDAVTDIDPFTIFGLFNRGITKANRILILNGIAKEFSLTVPVPNSFDGIPVVNNLNTVFYRFTDDPDRGEHDIDNLWGLFEAALSYADKSTTANKDAFISAFDTVKDLKGNRWKLTMGLYWIRPMNYINLDSRNRWYIEKQQKMSADCIAMIKGLKTLPTGTDYLHICDKFAGTLHIGKYEYKNFPELSYYAWNASEKANHEQSGEDVPVKRGNTGAALADENVDGAHYWIYAPGNSACKWDEFYKKGVIAIGWGEIGNLTTFHSKDEMKVKMKERYGATSSYMNAALATWQFAHEMKPGDVVFVKKGMHQILGRGVVTSEYFFQADRPDNYNNMRKIDWTNKGEWTHPGQAVLKTLTDITPYTDYVAQLRALFECETDDSDEDGIINYPPYSVDNFLEDVYLLDEDEYNNLVDLLLEKKNIILQGAAGVGKTYMAKRLAYSMMGEKNKDRVTMIQFHQSYSYEDFIMGFRPTESGFELRKGVFYNFCKSAEIDNENAYFFIIDEINRGNLSKIFGELFMLIEKDKRNNELRLLYSDEKFAVPDNVYIIGMMNTADRSLAILDYALRRRFAFYDLKPTFKSDGFKAYRMELDNPKFDRLISCVIHLNDTITADESLGEGFCIGHSYFCGLKEKITDRSFSRIIEYEIIPLLKEYWFDESEKVNKWASRLREAIQ